MAQTPLAMSDGSVLWWYAHALHSSKAMCPFTHKEGVPLPHQVLSLYRAVLRASLRLDPPTRASVAAYARHELDAQRHLPLAAVQRVEHLLRKGRKQLAQLQDPHFSGFTWQAPQRQVR